MNLFENIYLKTIKKPEDCRPRVLAVELIRLLHTPYGRANSTANRLGKSNPHECIKLVPCFAGLVFFDSNSDPLTVQ